MAIIRRLVLDVLVPHHPNIIEFANALACQGDYKVKITVVEMDARTQTLVVIVDGADIDFERIQAAIGEFGGSLHSIDEVKVRTAPASSAGSSE